MTTVARRVRRTALRLSWVLGLGLLFLMITIVAGLIGILLLEPAASLLSPLL